MSVDVRTWKGASSVVDADKVQRRGAWYVAEYRLRNSLKWWQAIVAFGIGNPVLYLASIGIGVGALVTRNVGAQGVDGVAYLTFLAPALLSTAAIQGAMEEVTFPTMHGFLWRKVFYAMNATAITGKQIAQGVIIAAMMRAIFTTTVYAIVLWICGAFTGPSALWALPASLFAGAAFAAVMLAVTVRFLKADSVFSLVNRFVIAPMFMFSGTYYPLESMPHALQAVGWLSPLWHATDIGRALMYGRPVSTSLMVIHFAYLSLMLAWGLHYSYKKFTERLAA